MSRFTISRRGLLTSGGLALSSAALAGCGRFDFLGSDESSVRQVLAATNSLTYQAQRLFVGDALAQEFAETEIRQGLHPNGSTDPQTDEYLALRDGNFASYRLAITGLVDRPSTFSLGELRNMPSRTQITRHDCVEGWSCIGKWTGVPLAALLDQVGVKATARFVVFHCYDRMDGGLSGPIPYYESCDLVDARHPQTIVAYGLNGAPLPVRNGAPLRVRIERQLGYKMAKYVHTIELADSLAGFGSGSGGYWEDTASYDWYGGI
jgi:DMSO/TMAO reductase YedYZ molybdopterin-dependent catalytic subunit